MSLAVKDSGGTEIDRLAKSLTFNSTVNRLGNMSFANVRAAGAGSSLERGEDVYVYDGATKLWGGTVMSHVVADVQDQGVIKYTYGCADFDEIASRRVVAEAFEDTTAGAIVTSLRTTYLGDYSVTAGDISTGAVIDRISFNYKSVSVCLDELAELSGFTWGIDKDKTLFFRARDEVDAPFDLSSSNKPFSKLSIRRPKTGYRNKQYVRAGHDLTPSRAEVQTGDGQKRAFLLEYKVGVEPTIRADTGSGYVSQTVGVLGVDSGKQYYYSIGSSTISQGIGETVLTSSHTLEVTYQGRFPIIVAAQDDDEIAARAGVETGTGVYERVENRPSIDKNEQALATAEGLLEKHKLQDFVTYTTFTGGLEAGMLQSIVLSDYGLNEEFLIESVHASEKDINVMSYTVRAISGQALGGWAAFFKKLVNSSTSYVIRENEVLVILRRTKDDMTIADSLATATYSGAYTVNGTDTYINAFHVG